MLPQEIIRRKRDGQALGREEIEAFINGLTQGRIVREQAAAFAMATFLNGMTRDETVALTAAMTASGAVLEWASLSLPGPVVDKHSTGGVGDNVSLVLAPIAAACGAFVPMISGRGLGHSGGTLDKLESIPGYRTDPDLPGFRNTVRTVGCAIIGQTADLAPADGILYSVRDVTATVESIPLITASILSKKCAAGLQGLVMDVKTGSGAFMTTPDRATALAQSLVEVADGAGLPTSALVTDMNQSLASATGNALEVRNAIDHLTGRTREPRLHAVIVALAVDMLLTGRLAETEEKARDMVDAAIASGAAAERFGRMVAALGGPADLVERQDRHLSTAPVMRPVHAERSGFVQTIDTRALGLAVVALGGGRTRPQEAIDPRVGFTDLAPLGARMPDGPLGIVHASSEAQADRAAGTLRAAYTIGETPPLLHPPVLQRFGTGTAFHV